MDDIERLAAIQEIKQVKAKYFWGLDHKDWDLWRREVWAPDGRLEVPEVDEVHEPLEKVIEAVSSQVGDQVSVHHGHQPIIEFTSDTEAKVIWAMEDRLYRSKEYPLLRWQHAPPRLRPLPRNLREDWTWAGGSSRAGSTRLRVEMTKVFGHPGDRG